MTDDDGVDGLLGKLRGLMVHVEQLGAELHDPETTDARREDIRRELRAWQAVLREFDH